MPPVARGSGQDTVFSLTGSGRRCQSPLETATGTCSDNVFVNGYGAVRKGHIVAAHPASGCSTDESQLTTYSGSVFANNNEIARLGDQYTSDNTITSGSTNIFAG